MVQVSRRVLLEYQCEVEKIYTSEEQLCSLQPTIGSEKGRQCFLHMFSKLIIFLKPPHSDSSVGVSWPVYVQLTNGKTYGCDVVVSATGVIPNTEPFLSGNKVSKGRLATRHQNLQTSSGLSFDFHPVQSSRFENCLKYAISC